MKNLFVLVLILGSFFSSICQAAEAQDITAKSYCDKLQGELMISLSEETRFQAHAWWRFPLIASWIVYVEPYSGSTVALYFAVKQIMSKYKSSDLQRSVGEVIRGKYSNNDCSLVLESISNKIEARDTRIISDSSFRKRGHEGSLIE
jgi:hypothetical protein